VKRIIRVAGQVATHHPTYSLKPNNYSFSIKDKVGALDDVLGYIRKFNISLTRIESRPSKTKGHYEFFVDFTCQSQTQVDEVVNQFRNLVSEVNVISGDTDNGKRFGTAWNEKGDGSTRDDDSCLNLDNLNHPRIP
jgi:hypothetical protein